MTIAVALVYGVTYLNQGKLDPSGVGVGTVQVRRYFQLSREAEEDWMEWEIGRAESFLLAIFGGSC